jgi:hypothetical protein
MLVSVVAVVSIPTLYIALRMTNKSVKQAPGTQMFHVEHCHPRVTGVSLFLWKQRQTK